MNVTDVFQFAAGLVVIGIGAVLLAFAIGAALLVLASFRHEAARIERGEGRR